LKRKNLLYAAGLLAAAGLAPAYATVAIQSMTPSVASPQPVGTTVTWTAKATDSATNTLTFQFSVASGSGPFVLVSDFNSGKLATGVWTAQPFVWTTIAGEATYTVQVIAKDFVTGNSATKTATYKLQSRVSGGVASVHATLNPLVALFSAPSCPVGSSMRVAFYPSGNISSTNYTTWIPCNGTVSMNVYVAGMLASSTYSMYPQTQTGGKITSGATIPFVTRALPSRTPGGFFPTFTQNVPPPTGDPNPMLLWSFTKIIVPVATDLNGNIVWYYGNGSGTLLTRPVGGGTMLTIQNGSSWASTNQVQQLLREVDLAGNIVHETNTGVITNQLVAMGVTDATPCGQVKQPPKVGDACLNDFHHDAIRLPNGNTAYMAHVEKLYPPGTQGVSGTAPVDILSEMVIVLNTNWQVIWSYDAFNELDINRTAPLNESCTAGGSDCPTQLFLSTKANDWTHANTVDYVASNQNPDGGDFLVSMRNQDQIIKINYKNGAGSCAPSPAPSCIGWYMGPPDGVTPSNFTFNNITNDPWPWFSHQHDTTFTNSGIPTSNGPLLTIFDNGNTRYSKGVLGLGSNCAPNDCNSRGMALTVDETNMTVTPVILQDLGTASTALGGAQILSNGNYFYQSGIPSTQAMELKPTTGVAASQVMNVGSVDYSYRGWQMPNLYTPPVL